ncbi:MAG: helix-turn-helix domain-containing protein [Bacteroidales bacterium]|nr:helix-turn-helix domain-containing protein [Bacteroidales bacterium]
MDSQILKEVLELKQLIAEQTMLQKEVLNFNETAVYLEVSHSNLYKLTSTGKLSYYKPNGKKIYFTRKELDAWLLSNRQSSEEEILERAANLKLKPGRR